MKVMKAMKRLKFWSRKKRKRKQASPSQPHHCTYEYSSSVVAAVAFEPTAPPLSFWFDETQDLFPPETSAFPWNDNTQLPHQQEETIVETKPLLLSQVSDLRIYQSYQQYMVPNPTYGVPIIEPEPHDAATAKRSSVGIFGCVIELSSSLVRCFIP
ncbi:PREDICTED: uncharacterized protein LOC104717857 [Camelina sativa]|uniref:Uncharacterized protein LOC104717857 n=1 Tax=Camelina sativa TaxID=90675 RepID=A0ABM0TZU8_CAMSA|nr:PREDICTED: uncharacterized protein LOC104717857 [Camelina sativa]